MNDCEKRGYSKSEPNFLAEIQVNIGQKHLRILHSFSQPPRVITSPSTYTHKFAFDIRLAAGIMAFYIDQQSLLCDWLIYACLAQLVLQTSNPTKHLKTSFSESYI